MARGFRQWPVPRNQPGCSTGKKAHAAEKKTQKVIGEEKRNVNPLRGRYPGCQFARNPLVGPSMPGGGGRQSKKRKNHRWLGKTKREKHGKPTAVQGPGRRKTAKPGKNRGGVWGPRESPSRPHQGFFYRQKTKGFLCAAKHSTRKNANSGSALKKKRNRARKTRVRSEKLLVPDADKRQRIKNKSKRPVGGNVKKKGGEHRGTEREEKTFVLNGLRRRRPPL